MIDPKTPIDVTAIAVGAGTLMDFLPSVASLLTVIWMVIRIFETETVRRWLGRYKS